MRRLIFLIAVMALLVPGVAEGTSSWTKCDSGDTTSTDLTIDTGMRLCFHFTTTEDSGVFNVKHGITALITFDPATDSEGADAAQVTIRRCSQGWKPAADPNYRCSKMHTSPLTGLCGDWDTQLCSIRVGMGAYYIDNEATAADPDVAIVTIEGE